MGELVNYGCSKQIEGSKITSSTWVLDLEDVEKNSGKLLQKKYGTKTTSNKSCFKKGDVLYGKLRPYLNKVLIADEDGCCSTEIVPINVSSAKLKIDAEFLSYFLRSPYFVGYANSCAYGVKMPRLGTKDAKSAWVAIPPITEQRRIVVRLQKIRSLVEIQFSQLITEFPDNLKASILQEAIQGKLVPQLESEPKVELQNEKESFEIPFEIPSKWKWTTLEQICLQITDGEHKTPKYQIGGVPFLSVKDISSKKLNFSNTKFVSLEDFNVIKKRCYPQKGDILLSKVGSTGIPAIVDTDKEFALFVSVALLKLNKLLVLDKFLWYLLQSPLVQKQAKENTRGIGNKNWVLKAIKATMVPLPPILEQHRIVDQLEKIFSSINSLSK